jgi:hypothetical protein
MGTRSKLLIVRKHKPDIHLWMRCDGYFNGVGDDICNQLKALLEKYPFGTILEMVNALDLEDEEEGQDFNPNTLIAFLEGAIVYHNDTCDDVEYEYTLNFDHQTFSGKGYDNFIEEKATRSLLFEQIKSGLKISDSLVPAVAEVISVGSILEMFMNLPKDKHGEAFEKIRAFYEWSSH